MFRRRCIVLGCRERRFRYRTVCAWHLGVERIEWREERLSLWAREYNELVRRLNRLCGR